MQSPPHRPEKATTGRFCRLFLCSLIVVLFLVDGGHARGENRLATSSSPYLRHHGNDPIQWHPWDERSLTLARQQDKLIFLSIGYFACHWCRVMGEESFKNAAVAEQLNTHFVPILVDREERPDLDAYYLRVAKAMTGRSGWPQILFLTPDGLPLFAGNYYPPVPQDGLPGLLDILVGLGRAWRENRAELLSQESDIRAQLQALSQPVFSAEGVNPEADLRKTATQFLLERVDERQGGFQELPKFPHPTLLSLMLREGVRQKSPKLLASVYTALDRMAAGGLRDPLGGLFHRYAVDRFWHTPHYEILLADNALLAHLYLEAYQVSRESRYAWVARGILDGLLSQFLLADGGLATALAADSEGSRGTLEEGAYYVWTPAEVEKRLGAADAEKWGAFFVAGDGFGKPGALHMQADPQQLEQVHQRLATELQRLAQARQARPKPPRDDKVVTAWNSLAVSSFALAARVLDAPHYLAAAQAVLAPLLTALHQKGEVGRYRLGEVWVGEPFLDDYAFLLQALLDMYETDFCLASLQDAWRVAQIVLTRYRRAGSVLLSLTPLSEHDGSLPVQTLVLDQHGIPSGHGVAWRALARLNIWRGDAALTQDLAEVARRLPEMTGESAHQAGALLQVLAYAPSTAREVILVGERGDPMVVAWLRRIRQRLGVGESVAVVSPDQPLPDWLYLGGRGQREGKPTAYVCRAQVCLEPVTDLAGFIRRLDE